MSSVFVSIGSNVQPEQMVPRAIAALRREFGAVECSPVYRSAAVGFDGAEFLNLVCRFDSRLSAREVNRALHAIEAAHGRRRDSPRFSDRSLDLDLLLHGELCMDEDGLVLPRAEILSYAFVLGPLADLAPTLCHPVLGRSYRELWADFDQRGQELTRVDRMAVGGGDDA